MDFLQAVAKDIYTRHQEGKDYTIIFPNARSIKYFKKYYSQLIEHPQALRLIPWQSFLDDSIDYQRGNNLTLIFELFQSFRKILAANPLFKDYTLDKFFSLGQTILSDFNEIDNYLIDPGKIFVNLADLEKLTSYDFITKEQKEAIEQLWSHYAKKNELHFFVDLFNNLKDIYFDFRTSLIEKKQLYSGLRNRIIVEKLKQGEDLFQDYDNIAFVGFYALSTSEREIMSFIKKNHNGIFYWDLDKHYYGEVDKDEEIMHEAGLFLRKNIKEFGNALDDSFFDNLLSDKNVKVISAPKNIAQAKILSWAMEDMQISNKPEKLSSTAIILLEESLLFPVLYSLPDYVDSINITLQYPFYLTPLYSFFSKWLALLRQLISSKRIYLRDFMEFIKTEVAQKYFNDFVAEAQKKLGNKQMSFITEEFFKQISFAEELFLFDKNPSNLLSNFLFLVDYLFVRGDDFEREYLYNVYENIKSLESNLQEVDNQLDVLMVIYLLTQVLFSIRVPFEGESLDNMQIMTIMETRNIDFENVIILGMNEGIFPSISRNHSFLSEFIRRAYNLPVLRYQDSLYSYIFYRLIQRAKNVYLVYNSIPDQGVGGKSRYILQLEKETNLVSEYIVFTDELVIPEVYDNFKLTEHSYSRSYITASAINTYLQCPRQFFYKYIVEVEAPQDIETPEFSYIELGSAVHLVLEKIYGDIAESNNNLVDVQSLKQALLNIDEYIDKYVIENEDFKEFDFSAGMNKIILEVVKDYVRKVLVFDMENTVPFEIISLEKNRLKGKDRGYAVNFDLDKGKEIVLYGIFDRVDKKVWNSEEIIRIVDYKTGKIELKNIRLDDLFSTKPNNAAFQLLFYHLIFKHTPAFANKKVIALLYPIRNLDARNFMNVNGIIYNYDNIEVFEQEVIPDFEKNLRQLLNRILFEDKSFDMTEDTSLCANCPYRNFCAR